MGLVPVRAWRRRARHYVALSGPDDSGNQGRFIPSTAVDQYTATLAQWYGLAPGDVNAVFPNINKFNSSNLGFLS